jgi:hypothetical protein
MPSEESRPSDARPEPRPSEDPPAIEDAYEPDAPREADVPEDDPQLLDPSARALEAETTESTEGDPPEGAAAEGVAKHTVGSDEADDAASIPDEPDAAASETEARKLRNWDRELSPHKVVVELKRVETEVRRLLEGRDGKRKRKLSGSRRWRELEEDILAWRHSGRVDEATLTRLHELVARRDYLFRRLRFLAGTRPTWNT